MSVKNIIVESTGVSSVPRVKVKLRVDSFAQVVLGVLKAGGTTFEVKDTQPWFSIVVRSHR